MFSEKYNTNGFQAGKGMACVLFEDQNSLNKALQMNNAVFSGNVSQGDCRTLSNSNTASQSGGHSGGGAYHFSSESDPQFFICKYSRRRGKKHVTQQTASPATAAMSEELVAECYYILIFINNL